MKTSIINGVIVGLVACALPGCSQSAPDRSNSPATGKVNGAPASAGEPVADGSAFLAAAEPFENLTETAPGAPPQKLAASIAATRKTGHTIAPSMPAPQRRKLEASLSGIAEGNATGDRAEIALAAVEGYRALVESAGESGKIPQAVSLLDYAGFRFQANLAADPVRWDDAAKALSFARSEWAGVAPRVHDAALSDKFSGALDKMERASSTQDRVASRRAAITELDLVDELENYFTGRPGG